MDLTQLAQLAIALLSVVIVVTWLTIKGYNDD